jgi:hypothetical protein
MPSERIPATVGALNHAPPHCVETVKMRTTGTFGTVRRSWGVRCSSCSDGRGASVAPPMRWRPRQDSFADIHLSAAEE